MLHWLQNGKCPQFRAYEVLILWGSIGPSGILKQYWQTNPECFGTRVLRLDLLVGEDEEEDEDVDEDDDSSDELLLSN